MLNLSTYLDLDFDNILRRFRICPFSYRYWEIIVKPPVMSVNDSFFQRERDRLASEITSVSRS
jgi:hypothetical protein